MLLAPSVRTQGVSLVFVLVDGDDNEVSSFKLTLASIPQTYIFTKYTGIILIFKNIHEYTLKCNMLFVVRFKSPISRSCTFKYFIYVGCTRVFMYVILTIYGLREYVNRGTHDHNQYVRTSELSQTFGWKPYRQILLAVKFWTNKKKKHEKILSDFWF